MSRRQEVTAVVLSLGEDTTRRALESLARQTHPPADLVRVDGVTPFHRAFNLGVSRVRTPWFVQVDSDMILDDDCVESLVSRAGKGVGLVAGHLRDPLQGRVQAVKLFRTECFRADGFPDSVSPDTDFLERMQARGWLALYAIRHRPEGPRAWHTFGEHRPDYSPLYTYGKLSLEGRRWRHRGDAAALRHHLALLHRSPHPAALRAEVALGHGVFLEGGRDLLEPYREDRDFARLEALLARPPGRPRATRLALPALTARAAFRRAYERGIACGRQGDGEHLRALLARLHRRVHPWDWLMQIGLCQGLFVDDFDAEAFERDWTRLRVFEYYYTPAGIGRRAARRLRRGTVRARHA